MEEICWFVFVFFFFKKRLVYFLKQWCKGKPAGNAFWHRDFNQIVGHRGVKDRLCYPESSFIFSLSVTCLQKINMTRKNTLIALLSCSSSKITVLQFEGLRLRKKHLNHSWLLKAALWKWSCLRMCQTDVHIAVHPKGNASYGGQLLLRFRGTGLYSSCGWVHSQ